MFNAQDSVWMARALRLAERGLYTTSPNPRVGCVLVNNNGMVGEGWHARAGEPHAEVLALNAAGAATRGATAFVTLEPCSHHGRTPPCADALIAAGVARVVVAVQDPNPKVAGEGIAKLRAAGIAVECGLMETAARELNAGFFARMTRGTPWLRSKIAMSLDGRTALANGVSRWITGDAARLDVQHWRARSCAVLTGITTVLADDARLNVREIETQRQPLRVVLDSRLRMPLNARILQGGCERVAAETPGLVEVLAPAGGTQRHSPCGGGVLIYTATHDTEKIAALKKAGALICVSPDGNGKVDLANMLGDLANRGCNEVLLEAGSTLNGALMRAGLVDELLLYLAPQLLGDMARGMVQLGELASLDQRVNLKWQDMRQVGHDLRIMAKVGNV
jgi:diaminohydroxyphosphoribosylaminopyrimidine deaminase/5-amino-6-(5-phosphoribosylamino)uracil reductase